MKQATKQKPVDIRRMDLQGRFYKDIRRYYKDDNSIKCPTKTCSRHSGSYDKEIRGSDYCNECGKTMVPVTRYYTERVYL